MKEFFEKVFGVKKNATNKEQIRKEKKEEAILEMLLPGIPAKEE